MASILSVDNTRLLYSANGITREKCELYSDYLKSLFMIIKDTYMGDDVTSGKDRDKHFRWCWNKNCNNFKKEGFYIDSLKLYKYFLKFTLETFYSIQDKDNNEKSILKIFGLWDFIFDWNKVKTEAQISSLVEYYNNFENSIINIKKTL